MFKKVVFSCVVLFASGAVIASGLGNSLGSKYIRHQQVNYFVFDHPYNIPFSTSLKKMVLQVDAMTKEGKTSDTVTLSCSGTIHKVTAGQSVVCENPGDGFVEDVADYKNGSSGSATFS